MADRHPTASTPPTTAGRRLTGGGERRPPAGPARLDAGGPTRRRAVQQQPGDLPIWITPWLSTPPGSRGPGGPARGAGSRSGSDCWAAEVTWHGARAPSAPRSAPRRVQRPGSRPLPRVGSVADFWVGSVRLSRALGTTDRWAKRGKGRRRPPAAQQYEGTGAEVSGSAGDGRVSGCGRCGRRETVVTVSTVPGGYMGPNHSGQVPAAYGPEPRWPPCQVPAWGPSGGGHRARCLHGPKRQRPPWRHRSVRCGGDPSSSRRR